MIRRPPRSTQSRSSAASDVYKRQDEIDYVAEFYSDDIDYFDLRTKDELREHLGDIIVDKVWGLERTFGDTETYKALDQAFGSEILASTLVTNEKTDELVQVELKKINTLNRHYLTIDEPNTLPKRTIEKMVLPTRRSARSCNINSACLLYTSPSPRDRQKSRMPSSA